MTDLEYTWIRQREPHLKLPLFEDLAQEAKDKVAVYDRETLIAARTAKLLGLQWPQNPKLELAG